MMTKKSPFSQLFTVFLVFSSLAFYACKSNDSSQKVLKPVSLKGNLGVDSDRGFGSEMDIALSRFGNVYISDRSGEAIYILLQPSALNGAIEQRGVSYQAGRLKILTAADYSLPSKLAIDSEQNIYLVENGQTIRKINPEGNSILLAGHTGPIRRDKNLKYYRLHDHPRVSYPREPKPSEKPPQEKDYFFDGQGAQAKFNQITDLALDQAGNIYVSDDGNHAIRKISPTGWVSTIAGSTRGEKGWVDGSGKNARFNTPLGLAVDQQGQIYIADSENNCIRRISKQGQVSTFLKGSLQKNNHNLFFKPRHLAIDRYNQMYISDQQNYIYKVLTSGQIHLLAGGAKEAKIGNGKRRHLRFETIKGIDVDPDGNLYLIEDTFPNGPVIRKITRTGIVSTLAE